MRALVAARHLMRAARVGKHADVDVLNVSSRDADGHDVLRLTGGRACMATDTAGVVDHLGPLNAVLASWFWLDHKCKGARQVTGELQAGMPALPWCGENISRQALALQTKLERRAQRVDVPGMRMAVVLSNAIKFEREMFVDLLDGAHIGAISYPRVSD